MRKSTTVGASWRRSVMLLGLTAPFAVCADHDSINIGQVFQRHTLSSSAPVPEAPTSRAFSGYGVNVGILDEGFDGEFHQVLERVFEYVGSSSAKQEGSHGSLVSHVTVGAGVRDDLGQGGAAYGSRLFAIDNSEAHVYDKLLAHGVKIINHSFTVGRYSEYLVANAEQRQRSESFGREFLNMVRHRDGPLLIWGVGNDAEAHPAFPAVLPSLVPGLEPGWIAVAGLDETGQLLPVSNACGIAANWCVSALTTYRLYDDYLFEGTSFAAPVVTSTAALVAEAYPWMNNSALRQTILSTADSLGDPAIYGWGRVNPNKAVRGPALFDSRLTLGGDFVADFDGYRSEFFNDIGGDRGLIKHGTGSLVLWGHNTYTGLTAIENGTLELYGRVAGDIDIGGVLFSDGGAVGGSVYNGRLLAVKGAGLSIKGDLDTSGAALQAELGSTIDVGGTASIVGATLEVVAPENPYVMKKRETVLRAAEIHGQFDAVSTGLLYNIVPDYSPTQVDLVVSRNNVAEVADRQFRGKRAKRAAGKAVEASLKSVDRQVQGEAVAVSNAFVTQAAALQHVDSVQALEDALESLTGEAYTSSQALNFQQAQAINRSLSNRVDALSHARGSSGLWVAMLGADGKLRQPGYASANTKTFGAQLGADHRLGHDTIVGGALSWSDANASFDGFGGRSKAQAVGVSLYGRHGAQTGNYVSGRIGHDWANTEVSRVIAIDRPERIDSDRHDGMTSLYAEFGRVFDIGGAHYSPFVGAEYNLLRRGAFAETGSEFALQAGSTSYKQAAALLGIRYQSAAITWMAGKTTLTGSGAYRYGNPTELSFSAAFTGAPDAAFTLQGMGLQRHSGWVGLGASTRMNSINLNWFINVDLQIDGHGLNNKAISAGLRYEFG